MRLAWLTIYTLGLAMLAQHGPYLAAAESDDATAKSDKILVPRRLPTEATRNAKPIPLPSGDSNTARRSPVRGGVMPAVVSDQSLVPGPTLDEPSLISMAPAVANDSYLNAGSEVGSAQLVGGDSSPKRDLDDMVRVVEEGTSSKRELQAAMKMLPLNVLDREKKSRAYSILRNLSFFRVMPKVRYRANPDVYEYFLTHPDVAVSMWRAMGVSKCQLTQTGPTEFKTDVGDGSVGEAEVLYHDERHHLVLGSGVFQGPMIVKPIEANVLLHLQTEKVPLPDGGHELVSHAAVFVMFPSQAVETAAKLISPVTNYVLDRNFREISLFAYMMTKAMEREPGWVEQIANRIDGVDKSARPDLLQLTARTYVAAKRRENPALSSAPTPEIR
ncbi:hypothetical protein [Calycomorphotria hydatis]|uniref:Uncharacterized protein n=1 Tax=Calycomorphotria hydatis TaxID=2528027 RepID=A0A517TC01_9PLAN|nr:hypothetical protein [Calycomorphotria hydatis]QDT65894.1 hypothetical protein V22_31570 [Calycomorphotria hydatis]